MRRKRTNHEIEIKLRVVQPQSLRLLFRSLGARKTVPRTYERNTLYDTPTRTLTRRAKLIRVRIERPALGRNNGSGSSETAILTYKGPPISHRAADTVSDHPNHRARHKLRYKIREEIEVIVSDGGQMNAILLASGLRPVFRYEKFRTTYALPGIPNVKIEYDETPIGIYLELEGTAAAIDRAAEVLGYTRSDFMTSSYGALYLADCRRRGRKPSNMLFQTTKKSRGHAVCP